MKFKELLPCPFCGGEIEIVPTDDEGNLKDDAYVNDPWGGLGYVLIHEADDETDCAISHHDGEQLGTTIYDTAWDAIEEWNKRSDQ